MECHPLPIGALISSLPGDPLAFPGQVQLDLRSELLKCHQPSEIARPSTAFLDPGMVYFGGQGRWGTRSETASAGPREGRHLFLKKTRPWGPWVTLALDNW